MSDPIWYRHKKQGTLHQVVEGSELHRRLAKQMTEVDEDTGEVPEPVYERLTEAAFKQLVKSPEKIPGYSATPGPRTRSRAALDAAAAAGGVPVAAAGPSEEDIQARIDAAVAAAVQAALATSTTTEADTPVASATSARTAASKEK